ncbi:hypothetical protein HK105_202064 [Polyrhizophydium stewartii]|uniref:Cytochrome b2 n=1 Tax=Polyrhizophydium stewartii TaxID=2732419 RepID=A0ABR4NF43_9FUNG|nr:hypothetical protein HK105_000426 [Polyrhizophydium stewartii]
MRTITLDEVAKHNSASDCWVVIHGSVYDLTAFLSEHPGGSKVILKQAGKDATAAFEQVHPRDIIEQHLPKSLHLGVLDAGSASAAAASAAAEAAAAAAAKPKPPPLDSVLNVFDFEGIAKHVLTKEAWAYYSSGGDDELTLQENHAAFHRIWLRPRVMRNVKTVDTRTTMLGQPSALPFYVTATALGKLGHPEGEVVLTRAAGTRGLIQMIPTLASCSFDELVDASIPGQPQFFQLYVNSDRKVTESIVRRAEARGMKGLFITVDAPQLGRREKDMRVKFVDDTPDLIDPNDSNRNMGAARAISHFIDPSLSWDDIPWFKSITKMPIVLKGVQTGEDAVLAAKAGLAGIVVSNHGGRQLDTVRSGIEILEEVVDHLKRHGLEGRLEIYVDGGFRRGTDIFKALALGARGIGLGRPFLYAMSTYGQAGVERAIDLLRDELEMTMRLMGVTSISQITRDSVLTKSLSFHAGTPLYDSLSRETYDPLRTSGDAVVVKSKL